jgi:tRNA threonylcarbamoyl adenosine modification protein YeaZ
LVTAAVLADALTIPAYGVGTLDALGWATTGRVLVATDARRREVYWAVYQDGRPLTPPAVGRPAELGRQAEPGRPAELDLPDRIDAAVGEGARRYADILGLPVHEPWYPPAAGLVELAAGRIRDRAPGEILTPLYLRRPDAVEPASRKAVLP